MPSLLSLPPHLNTVHSLPFSPLHTFTPSRQSLPSSLPLLVFTPACSPKSSLLSLSSLLIALLNRLSLTHMRSSFLTPIAIGARCWLAARRVWYVVWTPPHEVSEREVISEWECSGRASDTWTANLYAEWTCPSEVTERKVIAERYDEALQERLIYEPVTCTWLVLRWVATGDGTSADIWMCV